MKHFYFIPFCILLFQRDWPKDFTENIVLQMGYSNQKWVNPKILYDGTVVIPQLSGQLQKFDGYKFEVVPNVLMSGCCTGGFANLKIILF